MKKWLSAALIAAILVAASVPMTAMTASAETTVLEQTVDTTDEPLADGAETPADGTEPAPEETPDGTDSGAQAPTQAPTQEPTQEPTEEPTQEPVETPVEHEEGTGGETPESGAEEGTDGQTGGLQALVNDFIEQLKERYGDEWQEYYDAIIAEWGSVEEYLLSLMPEDAPDVVKDGWEQFVAWLNEYAPVWASILAAVFVLIVVLFGRKALKKIVEFVKQIMQKFAALFHSANKQYKVLKAQNDALMALLGKNPDLEDKRKALREANEEMEKEDEEL